MTIGISKGFDSGWTIRTESRSFSRFGFT